MPSSQLRQLTLISTTETIRELLPLGAPRVLLPKFLWPILPTNKRFFEKAAKMRCVSCPSEKGCIDSTVCREHGRGLVEEKRVELARGEFDTSSLLGTLIQLNETDPDAFTNEEVIDEAVVFYLVRPLCAPCVVCDGTDAMSGGPSHDNRQYLAGHYGAEHASGNPGENAPGSGQRVRPGGRGHVGARARAQVCTLKSV